MLHSGSSLFDAIEADGMLFIGHGAEAPKTKAVCSKVLEPAAAAAAVAAAAAAAINPELPCAAASKAVIQLMTYAVAASQPPEPKFSGAPPQPAAATKLLAAAPRLAAGPKSAAASQPPQDKVNTLCMCSVCAYLHVCTWRLRNLCMPCAWLAFACACLHVHVHVRGVCTYQHSHTCLHCRNPTSWSSVRALCQ